MCANIVTFIIDNLYNTLHLSTPEDGCGLEPKHVTVVQVVGILAAFARRLHGKCLLILQSCAWLAAFPLEFLQANLFIALCFWRLALSIVVEVFPRHFFSAYCSFKDV
jgi:hypothetical protein